MIDESDYPTVIKIAMLGFISCLAATVNTILAPDRTFLSFLGRWVLGLFAGMVVGFVCDAQGIEGGWLYASISISSISAKPLIVGVIRMSQIISDNPKVIVDYVLRRKAD